MNFNHSYRKYFSVIALLILQSACSASEDSATEVPAMDSLVSAQWLSEHIDDPDLVVLDCTVLVEMDENGGMRSVNGEENFESGHIPGAGFADLMGDLSDTDAAFEFTAPSPQAFAAAMAKLGVGDNSRVVLYDNYNGAWAARVWWMLRWIGFDQAAILDGGLSAWTSAGGSLSPTLAKRPVGHLRVSLRPQLMADINDVRAAIDDNAVNIIDSLPAESYRGDFAMYGRPGHIASATSAPGVLLLDETGRFRSRDEMDMLFDGNREERTITYCGGGIAAAQNAFVMTRLGFEDVAVYDNSLQEWAVDPANPMETGSE
jgi:thiosulfate/3-mercaptopyruvate sulfurtransferase